MSSHQESTESNLREFLTTVLTDKLPDQLKKVNYNYKTWLAEFKPRDNANLLASLKDRWIKDQQELEDCKIRLQILLNDPSLSHHIKEIDRLLMKIYGEEYYSLDLLKFYNPLTFKLKV